MAGGFYDILEAQGVTISSLASIPSATDPLIIRKAFRGLRRPSDFGYAVLLLFPWVREIFGRI